MSNKKIIEKIFNKAVSSQHIHEGILLVENTSGDFAATFEHGGKTALSPIMTASIGKMYTTTCVLKLRVLKKLLLADPLGKYFEKSVLDGLHVYKGEDYSHKITIADLLFQNSGLPDIFEEGGAKKAAIATDTFLSFDEKLVRMKKLKPHFVPGTEDKAYYSDFNFDLLGIIIEQVAEMPLEKVYQEFIFNPLGLTKTYLPTSENEFIPNVYYKNESIHRPKTILSHRAGGACVSTTRETMLLLKSFFDGTLFPINIFKYLTTYRKLQFNMTPIRYGGGFMYIPIGGLSTLFKGNGELVGHSGSTGCCAFYHPSKDLFIVCDFNQMASPALPVRVAMKIAMMVK